MIAIFIILGILVWIGIFRFILGIYIKNHSVRLKELRELNSGYEFNEVDQRFVYLSEAERKPKYDNYDAEKLFYEEVKEDPEHFQAIYDLTVENREIYEQYEAEFTPIITYAEETKSPIMKLARKIEQKELDKTLLKPVLAPDLVIAMQYISPQGRNRYYREESFRLGKIPEAFEKIERDEAYKKTAKYQRSRMSQNLRYKILQRDGFRCVLCGRSAAQGVELEVDHLVPIAKGGTTDEHNLRTLCKDCNRGKGDSYIPNWVN